MRTYIFEAGQPGARGNWGKFLVGIYDFEWRRESHFPGNDLEWPLIRQMGWGREHVWVLDMQTGEGALFRPGGYARADLNRHRIWVCPMFEPFLTWMYRQDLRNIGQWPTYVELEAPFELHGYRRPGRGVKWRMVFDRRAVRRRASGAVALPSYEPPARDRRTSDA